MESGIPHMATVRTSHVVGILAFEATSENSTGAVVTLPLETLLVHLGNILRNDSDV